MSFPRYPEYKDSGVEWLGEVPAGTVLGNWYATELFWKPQVALLVNENTRPC